MNCLPLFCFAYRGVASVAFAFSVPPFSTNASWKLLNSIFLKVDDLRYDGLDISSFSCRRLSDPSLAISLTSKSFEVRSDDSPWRKDSLLTTDIEPSSALLINFKKSLWSFLFLFPCLFCNYYLLDLYYFSKSVFFKLSVAVFSPPSLLSI
jgi:hypothetical protein